MHRHHLSMHTPVFRRLIYFSWFYIGLSVFNGCLAIWLNLKAQFFNWQTQQPVWIDYVFGIGTAISPPLLLSGIQFLLTDLAFKHSKAGNISVAVLFWLNVLNCSAALLQPAGIHQNTGSIQSAMHILMIVSPAVMVWLCFDVFLNRFRENGS